MIYCLNNVAIRAKNHSHAVVAMFGVLRPPSPPEQSPPASAGAPPPPSSLAPMPPREFATRDDLLAGAKDWAASQGYAVVIARSRENRLWLKCDRGGSYENRRNLTKEQRKRKRGESRLLGCPFRMVAVAKRDGSWKVETATPEHNHVPSEDLTSHPTLRRMSEAQLLKVYEMFEANKSPAETMEDLKRTWPEIKVLTRDIYNARKKYKTQKGEAAVAAGVAKKPVSDPNGVFPGPDDHGRWAWVPDGEAVTNKQSKGRRKKTAAWPAPQISPPQEVTPQTLDPQLQDLSPAHQIARNARTSLSLEALMNPSVSEHGGEPQERPYQNLHENSRHSQTPVHRFDTAPDIDDGQEPRDQTPATAIDHTPLVVGPSSVESPAVLAVRIQRMEKEQQDQKNMLAQILGAVKGMSGSPPV